MIDIESNKAVITLVIVSSNHWVRSGLQAVIYSRQHLRLIGEAASARETEDAVIRKRPHVLIIQMGLDVDIVNLVRKIKAAVPTTKIIVLADMEDTQRIQDILSAGIDGVVLNSQPAPVLLATIDYVGHRSEGDAEKHNGMGRPDVNATGHHRFESTESTVPKYPEPVTKREREIVALVGEALSNKDIARRLGISSITVRHHLTSIFDKLGVTTRQELLLRSHQKELEEPRAFASPFSDDP